QAVRSGGAGRARGSSGSGRAGGSLRALRASRAGGAGCARSAFVGQQTPGVGTGIGGIIRDRFLLAAVAGAVVLHAVVHGIGGCVAPVGLPHQTSGAGRSRFSRRACQPLRTLSPGAARGPCGAGSAGGSLRALRASRAGGAGGARSAFVGQRTPGVGTGIRRIIRVRVLLADVAGAVVLHARSEGASGRVTAGVFPPATGGGGRARGALGACEAL